MHNRRFSFGVNCHGDELSLPFFIFNFSSIESVEGVFFGSNGDDLDILQTFNPRIFDGFSNKDTFFSAWRNRFALDNRERSRFSSRSDGLSSFGSDKSRFDLLDSAYLNFRSFLDNHNLIGLSIDDSGDLVFSGSLMLDNFNSLDIFRQRLPVDCIDFVQND